MTPCSRLFKLFLLLTYCLLLLHSLQIVLQKEALIGEQQDTQKEGAGVDRKDPQFYKPIPGTNWTLFDIRKGEIMDKQQIIGVEGDIR